MYDLNSQPKWPLQDTFDPDSIQDLYHFWERVGKRKEIPDVQAFSIFCLNLPCVLPALRPGPLGLQSFQQRSRA